MYLFAKAAQVHSFIRDSGPLYYETSERAGIIEPWNAFSSLIYLIPAVWFLYKLNQRYSKYPFIVYFACPLLIAGGTGSTLYHAFRSSNLLMWLDVAPVFILTLSLGAYFYWLSYRNKVGTFLLLVFFVFIRFLGFYLFELQTAINISYFLTGVYIFIPSLLLLVKMNFRYLSLIAVSAVLLSVALFMRWYDDFEVQFFSAGTHWLWHIFSAAGALFLGLFIEKAVQIEDKEV